MDIVERLRSNADERFAVWQVVTTMNEAADEIERLREAIKVQANAVRSLHYSETAEINRLRKTEREAHIAIKTLDSERKANAILTDEIERLREALQYIADDTDEGDTKQFALSALQQKESE